MKKAIQRALMQYKKIRRTGELILEGDLKNDRTYGSGRFWTKVPDPSKENFGEKFQRKNPESRSTDRRNLKTQNKEFGT